MDCLLSTINLLVNHLSKLFIPDNSDELIVDSFEIIPIKNINANIKKIKFTHDINYENNETKNKFEQLLYLQNNTSIISIDLLKYFKYNYNYIGLDYLPTKLKILHLHSNYINKINNFPSFLEILTCSYDFYVLQEKIPDTIKKLTLSESGITHSNEEFFKPIKLTNGLIELYFINFFYCNELRIINNLIKIFDKLPSNLKILQIPYFWNNPLNNLPSKLKILYLGGIYNQPIDNLPIYLEKIYFGIKFNQSLDFLPESIKYISFSIGRKFNKSINNLPNSLKYLDLDFQEEYSHSIDNLPNSIEYLSLGDYYLQINKLPDNLIKLKIATHVKFILMPIPDVDIFDELNKSNKIKKKYYKLENIGKYNIENNITIHIPHNLSTITYCNIDNDYSVYTYIRENNSLWYRLEL